MITILEHPEISSKDLKSRYKKLMDDASFLSLITGATTDTAVLRARVRKAVGALTGS